jgi:hypothetical protein
MSCFVNETENTTLLPAKDLRVINLKKAKEAEKVAVSAQTKRSTARRCGPSTLTDVEELIGCLVSSDAGKDYLPLLPHAPDATLYYKVDTSACHVNMLKQTAILGVEPAGTTSDQWRRFIGQQLMLLTELITFCVPAFFADNAFTINPLGKRKARGAVRSD